MKPIHLAPLDETGHALPPIDPNSDVMQLLYLLETARVRGYEIGPEIQIGQLTTRVRDLRQTEGRPQQEVDRGPWAAAGHDEGNE